MSSPVRTCGCGKPLRDNAMLCHKCTGRLEQDLAEIPSLFTSIPGAKYGQRGGGSGNIGVTSRSAQTALPFNDKPVEVADALRLLLREHAGWVVTRRGVPWPRDFLPDLAHFLQNQLGWIRRQEEAPVVHQSITHAVSRLRGSIDGRRREQRSWGRCGSVEYDEETGQPQPDSVQCPAEVRAWRGARRATCEACGTTHELNQERQDWLLEQARGEVMYVAQLSQTLEVLGRHVADPTIRSWIGRGQLVEHSRDAQGRALFLVGHVIDLARAAAVRQAARGTGRRAAS